MKISIIMPIFNCQETIGNAIESVINQTYSDWELVVVDGNSTDGTDCVLQNYSNRIDILISEADDGYADALNKGIKASSGEFILMLAGDDKLLPGALEKFATSVTDDLDVWCGAVVLNTAFGYLIRRSHSDLSRLYQWCSLENAASFYRRSIFNQVGLFDTSYRCAADREMFLRLLHAGVKFFVSDAVITVFGLGGLSTANPERFAIPEDERISLKYGVDPCDAAKNAELIRKSLKKQMVLTPVKIALFKLGIICHVYKIMGKRTTYLTASELERL